jgi:tetratricopeptide (TPR) repeat protein
MTPKWRIVVVTVVLLGCGFVMAVHPQDVSDIASMARDLKKTLKDVDERLRHLEKLVKDLSAAKKNGSRTAVQPSTVASGTTGSSNPLEAQAAYLKGRIEEDSQQYAQAVELFTKACELDSANDSAFLHRAFVN